MGNTLHYMQGNGLDHHYISAIGKEDKNTHLLLSSGMHIIPNKYMYGVTARGEVQDMVGCSRVLVCLVCIVLFAMYV